MLIIQKNNGQTDRQTERKTERQTDRQTDRQTETDIQPYVITINSPLLGFILGGG